jgi:hypothetical protein
MTLQPTFETFPPLYWGFLITHNYKHGRTPLDESSARRSGLYLHGTTQHIKKDTNMHAVSGIRTRDPGIQAAAELHLGTLITKKIWIQILFQMSSTFVFWFLSSVLIFCDAEEKLRSSVQDRVEIIMPVKNYFQSGCLFFVESLNENLQGKKERNFITISLPCIWYLVRNEAFQQNKKYVTVKI